MQTDHPNGDNPIDSFLNEIAYKFDELKNRCIALSPNCINHTQAINEIIADGKDKFVKFVVNDRTTSRLVMNLFSPVVKTVAEASIECHDVVKHLLDMASNQLQATKLELERLDIGIRYLADTFVPVEFKPMDEAIPDDPDDEPAPVTDAPRPRVSAAVRAELLQTRVQKHWPPAQRIIHDAKQIVEAQCVGAAETIQRNIRSVVGADPNNQQLAQDGHYVQVLSALIENLKHKIHGVADTPNDRFIFSRGLIPRLRILYRNRILLINEIGVKFFHDLYNIIYRLQHN